MDDDVVASSFSSLSQSQHPHSGSAGSSSLTSSLYNILIQTISPRQQEGALGEETGTKQRKSMSRDRSNFDSNATTKTSSSAVSSRLAASENQSTTTTSSSSSSSSTSISFAFAPLSPSRNDLSEIEEQEQEGDQEEDEEEEVKRIEECYQENSHEFSVFGVLDDDDDEY